MTIEEFKAADEVLAKIVESYSEEISSHVKAYGNGNYSFETSWTSISNLLYNKHSEINKQRSQLAERFVVECFGRPDLLDE